MRLIYGFVGTCALALLFLFPVHGLTSASGASEGFSGGPGAFGTCQICHSSFEVNEGSGSVSVDAPNAFVANKVITLTVTVDNTTDPVGDDPIQGFQISVQDAEGNHVGQLIVTDPVNTQFSNPSTDYITHTTVGRLENTWTMDWLAPVSDDLPDDFQVTIYVAGNAANGDHSPAGDYIYTDEVMMTAIIISTEPPSIAGAFAFESIYPNPMREGGRVQLAMHASLPVSVTVYDGLGRAVRTIDAGIVEAGQHEIDLAISGFAPGTYFVEISTPEGALVRPMTIVR